MRWLGLDLGARRIGIALSDLLELTAQGYSYRERTTLKNDLEFFKNLIRDHEITGVVIGMPVNMDGTEGPAAEKARFFGAELQKNLNNVEVVFWDERLSTSAAQRVLIEADLSRRKRRFKVDQVAAVIILQNYLDYRLRIKK
jgi:putative Holliday junction resolvase